MVQRYISEESMWDEWPEFIAHAQDHIREKYPSLPSSSWSFNEGWVNKTSLKYQVNISFTAYDEELKDIILVNTSFQGYFGQQLTSAATSERLIVEYDAWDKKYVPKAGSPSN